MHMQVKAGMMSVSLLVEARDKSKGLDEEQVKHSSQERNSAVHFAAENDSEAVTQPPRDSFDEMKKEEEGAHADKMADGPAAQLSHKYVFCTPAEQLTRRLLVRLACNG
jgi:hypothetical protein